MRDLERWKDQVELSLDGRQIFFLFFGSAVAACVIFVAGVLVGKRIEQRACTPPAVADPLAVLDQADQIEQAGARAGDGEDGFTFHEALARREVRPRPSRAPSGPGGGGEAAVTRPAAAAATSEGKVEGKADGKAADGKAADGKDAKDAHKPNEERYTLHISAFSQKDDAEDFLHRMQAAGYRPSLVQSEIPGRGLFYRVRVGDFSSKKAALEAKSEFERRQRLPVYVAHL
ncbi:MAG TPA: SPOR domain-containing protein [Polyangia bacterium]|nr:SPOR domain-containing protein [Polyangia bacterium]